MNYKRLCHNRLCRVLICLVLICCLIAQMVPARANAIGLSGTVATGTAIAAGLVALGIGVGATETAFNNLVDSLTAVAGSDRVPVWISETADGFVTYLQESFLGSLLAHCFDSGVLSVSSPFYKNSSGTLGKYTFSATSSSDFYLATCTFETSSNVSLLILTPTYRAGVEVYRDGSYIQTYRPEAPAGLNYYSVPSLYYTYHEDVSNSSFPYLGHFENSAAFATFMSDFSPSDSVATTEDLALGSVGATMSSPNYDPWRTAAVPVVPPVVGGTADEEDALPVTFPGLDTPSITGQTQAGAQSGVTPGTVVDDILSGTGTGTGSGTGSEGLEGTLGETKAETFLDSLSASFSAWFAELKATGELIVEKIEALPAAFASWLEKILEWLAKILEAIKAIPGLIADAIANVLSLVFAVSDTFIATKVDALTAKYPYLETFIGLGSSLKAFFLNLGSKPPIIYIDLSAATGSYFFGGRQAFIDLTWYSDYKPTMDSILGAFIWLWLAWRVFHALPGIINGMSGTVGERVSYSGTQNINLPPLPPQNELPPGHNRRI